MTFSKLRFCKFKKLFTRQVSGELQLTQRSFNFKRAILNHAMSHYQPQLFTMTHSDPKYSHYDPQLSKLFYNDPK